MYDFQDEQFRGCRRRGFHGIDTLLTVVPALLLLMFAVRPGGAQALYGSNTGNVTDPSGAALAAADGKMTRK